MSDNIKNKFGIQRKRNYLNRDFSDFRLDLLRYANIYFKDKIQDFSEASMGGLFLDMAAYVGDNMSFYLDHQFRELDPTTAVESQNIEAMVRNAGIKITGNSPASVTVNFYIEVQTVLDPVTGETIPNHGNLPRIKDSAKVSTDSGIVFNLTEEIDFSKKDDNDIYLAEVTPIVDANGSITSFVFMRTGLCVSGTIKTQTIVVGSDFVPFRTITLDEAHVSSILRVYDSDGNDYYEVESLSQDTVFRKNKLSSGDTSIEVITAPYRYSTSTSITNRSMTLRFGSGNSSQILENTIPDPSDLALPLYGKSTFSSFSLDPNRLLSSPSLGVSPVDTTMKIIYRHGGGAQHNVEADSIRSIDEIEWIFLQGVTYDHAQSIKVSLAVSNPTPARGGAAAPTLSDLKNFVTSARTMQNRIVTTDDLLARIYTLPTEFGVVYRANVLPNPENALSSLLYVISRNSSGQLSQSSDALKRNLSTYLNEFRLIGDAMDVLDADVINYQIKITCRFAHNANKYELISLILRKVKSLFSISTVALGKPIVKSDILNVVINQPGVVSCVGIKLVNVAGTVQEKTYSNTQKNLDLALKDDIYFAEPYEIFELRFPNKDIIVTVL
jgi:hypothetical protein